MASKGTLVLVRVTRSAAESAQMACERKGACEAIIDLAQRRFGTGRAKPVYSAGAK